jgi:hypothetical protein
MADPKKPSNYDDVADEKTRKKANKAYEDASKIGSDDDSKGASIMDNIKKYNPSGHERIRSSERTTSEAGNAAVGAYKKGEYGSALKEGAKGLGSAANTLLNVAPTEGAKAIANRITGGEKYAKGGTASSRADGCAQRGKTKGMVVGMNKGGMSC